MSVLTPLGHLINLDISNTDVLRSLLKSEKHQMLEGIIIEGVFEKYIQAMENNGIDLLKIALVKSVFKSGQHWKSPAWWVWNYSNGENHFYNELKRKLSHKNSFVLGCKYCSETRDFLFADSQVNESIQKYMAKQRKLKFPLTFQDASENVKDHDRTLQAFWGGIHGLYGSRIFEDIVLHRIFKNFVIQPFFSALWDIDNLISLPDKRIMQLEVKHKYPYYKNDDLYFGINVGQLQVIEDLSVAGIDTLHVIMVKPYWNDRKSPSYLLQDPTVRDKVLILSCYLNSHSITNIKKSKSALSDEKTSFTGERKIKYLPIPLDRFNYLGTLADSPAVISSRISDVIAGKLKTPASKMLLENAKMTESS